MKTQASRVTKLLILFSIAMGYMEAAVVIYLRHIYYPAGFDFPLVPIAPRDSITELLREFATIIMLVTISIISGKNKIHRFAYFLLSFSIWDLTYYLVLKLILNWPASLFSWDILFLIPVPWIGPVLGPLVLCILMIIVSYLLLRTPEKSEIKVFSKTSLSLLISGAVVSVFSFLFNYLGLDSSQINEGANENKLSVLSDLQQYVPSIFHWELFVAGILLILLSTIMIHFRTKKIINHQL